MEYYREGLRRFLVMLTKEPNVIIMASLLALLFALPVVTVGIGIAAALHYCACHEQGRACTLRQAVRETAPLRLRAFQMGLLDIGLLLGGVASFGMLLSPAPLAFKAAGALLFCLDISFLLTALFRYPALVREDLPLDRSIHTAFAVALGNPGPVFLYWCVLLLLAMACAVTGIGLLLVLPGGFCMLLFTSWNTIVRRYNTSAESADKKKAA